MTEKEMHQFEEWWKEPKPAECDELKVWFLEAWEKSNSGVMKDSDAYEVMLDSLLIQANSIYTSRA